MACAAACTLSLLYFFVATLPGYVSGQDLPSTFPNAYPGMPSLPYSTEWQSYFNVSDPLPNVSFAHSRSFAGNIDVMREGHPNNTLFFWAWETKSGSLTADAADVQDDPYIIWLNGGPGSSSLLGFFVENGPIHVTQGNTPTPNPFSWDQLADTIWIDQPVGTGWATADAQGYAADEDQIATDFVNFLTNLVKVFPNLASRPLYLMGESYAGVYIPYIAKALFSMANPPVTLRKLSMGNGVIGSVYLTIEYPALYIIETFPQLISYNPEIYNYYKNQSDLCGFNLDLTYPQSGGTFPSVNSLGTAADPQSPFFDGSASASVVLKRHLQGERRRQLLPLLNKRQSESIPNAPLAGRVNGSIDPWYGCYLWEELWDTALNFSLPWSDNDGQHNIYDVPDALNPDVPLDPSEYVNDDRTRAALHAPLSVWNGQPIFGSYPFGSNTAPWTVPGTNIYGDPSLEPMVFLSELMANSSNLGVDVIFYSGNDDTIASHYGTEVVIQNMTFGGIQGFTKVPSTPWTDDNGQFAGIIHQERGVTYALFYNAGHQVPYYASEPAMVFVREFVLGSNTTGTVTQGGNGVGGTIGGEAEALSGAVIQAANAVFIGSGTTQGTSVAPSATVASWNSFIQTATMTSGAQPSSR